MELYRKFWEILFWLSLPIMAFLVWRIVSMEIKARRLKEQIQRDLHSPGMEETRRFLKPHLKEHGIAVDDKHYERN